MEFEKILLGPTPMKDNIVAYKSENFYDDRWLYLTAGIHGNETEGTFILTKLLEWLKSSFDFALPCILIPTIDIDGQYANTYGEASLKNKRNLNQSFPKSSVRSNFAHSSSSAPLDIPIENELLIKLTSNYPPEMLINFRSSATNLPKIISIGKETLEIAHFLTKHNHYSLVADNKARPMTLEAFFYDFLLTPIISIRTPKYTEEKHILDIWKDNEKGLKLLLSGQSY